MLMEKCRLRAVRQLAAWRRELLDSVLTEIPVTGEVGLAAVALPDLHTDPADRIIAVTASLHRATLVTTDRNTCSLAASAPRVRHSHALRDQGCAPASPWV